MTIAQMLEEGIKLGGNGRALFDDERVVTYPQMNGWSRTRSCARARKESFAFSGLKEYVPETL